MSAKVLPDCRHWNQAIVAIQTIVNDKPEASATNVTVLKLSHGRGGGRFSRAITKVGHFIIRAPVRAGIYMVGQIISRRGAQKILDATVPLWAPLDNIIYREAGILGLCILCADPAPIAHCEDTESMIGSRAANRSSVRGRFFKLQSQITRRVRAIRSYRKVWGLLALAAVRQHRK